MVPGTVSDSVVDFGPGLVLGTVFDLVVGFGPGLVPGTVFDSAVDFGPGWVPDTVLGLVYGSDHYSDSNLDSVQGDSAGVRIAVDTVAAEDTAVVDTAVEDTAVVDTAAVPLAAVPLAAVEQTLEHLDWDTEDSAILALQASLHHYAMCTSYSALDS